MPSGIPSTPFGSKSKAVRLFAEMKMAILLIQ
jgi:hypothetical protein